MTRAWVRTCLSAGVLILLSAGWAFAQHEGHQQSARPPAKTAPPEPKAPDRVGSGYEPIRCWRQSTSGAITIGESFRVILTCAVYDAENAQVVPDESRLNVASIQMAPFEILGGSHPADVRRGPRRFIQYEYELRIINPDAIGHDVNIPPLTISYRIHSRVGAAAAVEGRDLSYLLPMMPIKVLSLVPADASDIRDAGEASLGAIESLRFRSSLYRVLTLVFSALAVAMLILALVPVARARTAVAAADRGRVSPRAVARRAAHELRDLQSRTAGGWDDEMIGRVLAALRLIAAAAIGRGISQKAVTGAVPEGRLVVKHGLVRPVSTAVSSSITAEDLARAIAEPDAELSTTRLQQIEELQSLLRSFTAANYGRANRDSSALGEGVRRAVAIADDVAKARGWQR